MNWFYALDGQQAGPVDDTELARLAAAGTIIGSTLVWHSGLTNWQPYSSFGAGAAPAPVTLAKPVGAGEAQCVQCGRVFPTDEVVRLGNSNVCAECKPVFVQRLREGAVFMSQPFAGFGIRLGAAVLDGLILIPFFALYIAVFFFLAFPQISVQVNVGSEINRMVGFQFTNLLLSIGMSFVLAFYSAFCVSRYGGTPGKRICKLRIVRGEGGGKVTFWRAFARYMCKAWISRLILYIGYLFIIFDDQKRGLHDMICDTRVTHDEESTELSPTAYSY